MVYEIEITEEAQLNFEAAVEYYLLEVNESVAKSFTDEVYSKYDILSVNPFFQKRHLHYRGLPLDKFPHIIFFEVLELDRVIRILSIFHTSQDPKKYPH